MRGTVSSSNKGLDGIQEGGSAPTEIIFEEGDGPMRSGSKLRSNSKELLTRGSSKERRGSKDRSASTEGRNTREGAGPTPHKAGPTPHKAMRLVRSAVRLHMAGKERK